MIGMPIKEATDWDALDTAFRAEQGADLDIAHAHLLSQTQAAAAGRRILLQALHLERHANALDIGTGFGPVAFELAGLGVGAVTGVDNDTLCVETARRIAVSLRNWLPEGASVAFEEADGASLPFGDASFDLVTSFLLYQHISDPRAVTAEAWRVLCSGGLFCVAEVDNGLAVVYPETSAAASKLEAAYDALYEKRLGDRLVGRKLSTYLDNQGFSIEAVLVLPNAAHGPSRRNDFGRQMDLERLMLERDGIVSQGIMSADELNDALAVYADEEASARFRLETLIAVVGRKP